MFREIPFILAMLAEVGVTGATAKSYAPVIQELAVEHDFTPATMIALVEGESGWDPSRVNHLGCVGLGQHCVKALYPYCRSGSYDKVRCDARIAELKNPIYNLRRTAEAFTANRNFCNKKTDKRTKKSRSQWRHWLPSYGGYNEPKQGIWCGQKKVKGKWRDVAIPKRIKEYMKRRKALIRAALRKN